MFISFSFIILGSGVNGESYSNDELDNDGYTLLLDEDIGEWQFAPESQGTSMWGRTRAYNNFNFGIS